MRISDWSSDVCSSDLGVLHGENDAAMAHVLPGPLRKAGALDVLALKLNRGDAGGMSFPGGRHHHLGALVGLYGADVAVMHQRLHRHVLGAVPDDLRDQRALLHPVPRAEEHTSELQSLMRISYAVS